jgi:DNA-binding MarR family transcriptional regulator
MAPRKPFLRSLLRWRADWVEQQVYERAAANGYPNMTPGLVRLFGHMGGRPTSTSEIARRMSVSKQAVHQLANEAVRRGLVELIPSEHDGRVKLLRFTAQGWEMSSTAVIELSRIESEIEACIGAGALEELRRILALEWPGDSAAGGCVDQT